METKWWAIGIIGALFCIYGALAISSYSEAMVEVEKEKTKQIILQDSLQRARTPINR